MNNQQQITDGSSTPQRPFTNCPSSPAQGGRSLREFEEQMAALRKENFNLKLRIYFLEEKPTSSNAVENNNDLVNKQNIDLKVSEQCHGLLNRMA
jgi:Centrosomin N-terminal motif 1